MQLKLRTVLAISALTLTSAAQADISVVLVNVTSLPYDLSPNNYENSPNNYSNSVNNYKNSPNNYNNSPNNYTNSPNNYSNNRNKIIHNGSSVGYFVINKDGITNFFSRAGKRVFYNPADTSAVFTNEGKYAGVLAQNTSKNLVLGLTPEGLKYLLLQ